MPRRSLKSTRRLFLCTYDIADDKRRARLFTLLSDHGEHVQYSVFLCELNLKERASLVAAGDKIIHHEDDQLLVIDIGPSGLDWTRHLHCLGRNWTPMIRASII